jgi:hypothetical protein
MVTKRGGCMFIEKARKAEKHGALGVIVVDSSNDSSYYTSALFAMSGDGSSNDVKIPCIFLFGKEGNSLISHMQHFSDLLVYLGDYGAHGKKQPLMNGVERAISFNTRQLRSVLTMESRSCQARNLNFFDWFENSVCHQDDYWDLHYFFDLYNNVERASDSEAAKLMT